VRRFEMTEKETARKLVRRFGSGKAEEIVWGKVKLFGDDPELREYWIRVVGIIRFLRG
jgi:hypothetical protein